MCCVYQGASDRLFLPLSLMLLYICLRHKVIGKVISLTCLLNLFSDKVLQFIIARGEHDVNVSWL